MLRNMLILLMFMLFTPLAVAGSKAPTHYYITTYAQFLKHCPEEVKRQELDPNASYRLRSRAQFLKLCPSSDPAFLRKLRFHTKKKASRGYYDLSIPPVWRLESDLGIPRFAPLITPVTIVFPESPPVKTKPVPVAFERPAVPASDVRRYIPLPALAYFPEICYSSQAYVKDFTTPEYFGGLFEHESCITLTHPKCYSPKIGLHTRREKAVGPAQLTIAYNPDGTVRFDTLTELVKRHPDKLAGLSWNNPEQHGDLQIRAGILLWGDNWKKLAAIPSRDARTQMADAAYNQGLGRVFKDRTYCNMKPGCDPNQWFEHVELACTASKKALYAGRSPCDISRHHVKDVYRVRMPKYKGMCEKPVT